MLRRPTRVRSRFLAGAVAVLAATLGVLAPQASASDPVPVSFSDIRVTENSVTGTLLVRGAVPLSVDTKSVEGAIVDRVAPVTVAAGAKRARSTILVIDTSGSMGEAGMETVRVAVTEFLAKVPADVKVGMVSFASTSGVDVAPTTDRAKVQRAVDGLKSRGETSLYAAVQDAVAALGADGERSIVLLSDGGDTVAAAEGGDAREASQRKAALNALRKARVRAEVVAFKSPESNGTVLQEFAASGGGSVVNATETGAAARAFEAAAQALNSQVVLTVTRPTGVKDTQTLVLTGTAGGHPFEWRGPVNLGDTAPVVVPTPENFVVQAAETDSFEPLTAAAPSFLVPAIVVIGLGMFLLVAALVGPALRSGRSERVSAIEAYGMGRGRPAQADSSPTAISASLIHMGDKVMEGRESTTRTMELLNRADLPWRAGEWFVLRIIAVVVSAAVGFVLLGSHHVIGLLLGLLAGAFLPPFILRYLAKRRAKKFESILPDVLMLVATSLGSGFSLLQALDAVARDAPEPAKKEFSRALAQARIGSDIGDALDDMSVRMESESMRWTTMAIRIQREVGGNLAETLRTTAATLREREMLRRQVRALSAEGRLSAYILIALPLGVFGFSCFSNPDYISLLWTTGIGIVMLIAGILAMIAGIFWMRSVVKIEV